MAKPGCRAGKLVVEDRAAGKRLSLSASLIGVLAALWAGQLLSSFVFGVGARDPATISAVVIFLLGVAALACWLPARHASQIDPMLALRYE